MSAAAINSAIARLAGVDVFRIASEGATITVQPSIGYVSVNSAYHRELNGCHWWTARGRDVGIYEFVLRLDRDYVVGKLFGDLEEFDPEATAANFKRWVIEQRRDAREYPLRDRMTAEQARELWSDVESCERDDEFHDLPVPDSWEMLCRREKSCVEYFWQRIWTPFIEHVRSSPDCSYVSPSPLVSAADPRPSPDERLPA